MVLLNAWIGFPSSDLGRYPSINQAPSVDRFRFARRGQDFRFKCREATIGSSPGWSDDELRESIGTRGLRLQQRWRRAIDSQTQLLPVFLMSQFSPKCDGREYQRS